MASADKEPSGGDRWHWDLQSNGKEIGGGHIIWGAGQETGGSHLGVLCETLRGRVHTDNGECGAAGIPDG